LFLVIFFSVELYVLRHCFVYLERFAVHGDDG
jgi:hypothetical protein